MSAEREYWSARAQLEARKHFALMAYWKSDQHLRALEREAPKASSPDVAMLYLEKIEQQRAAVDRHFGDYARAGIALHQMHMDELRASLKQSAADRMEVRS